jgi:hypothetical protein
VKKLIPLFLIFVFCSNNAASPEPNIDEPTSTSTSTIQITTTTTKTQINECEETVLVVKTFFTLIQDIVRSSLSEDNYDKKIELFDKNKQSLREIGVLISNISVNGAVQRDLKDEIEQYRILAYADAAISYTILNENLDLDNPLWEDLSLNLTSIAELEESLSEKIEDVDCNN